MKYRVGDKIKCLPGFNNNSSWKSEKSGGAGYSDGEVFTIKRITINKGYDDILWFNEIDKGIFPQAVILYDNNYYEIY